MMPAITKKITRVDWAKSSCTASKISLAFEPALVEDPAADLRCRREAGEEDEEVEPGVRRRPAERDLRVHRREEEHRNEDCRREEQDHVLGCERAVLEDAHPDQRRRRPELIADEHNQDDEPDGDESDGRDAPPAPRARLLEPGDAEPHGRRHQDRAGPVDRRPFVVVDGLGNRRQHECDDRHGDVHPEDRAPRPLAEISTGGGTDGREPARDREEHRQRPATLVKGEGLDHDRQRGRVHERGAGALHDTERDDPDLGDVAGRRQPVQGRRAGEDHDAEDQHLAVAEDIGEPAAEREQRRKGDEVTVDHPLQAGRRERELLLDLGGGDRHDRLIDERHRDREDHRHEHQVLRAVLLGNQGRARRRQGGPLSSAAFARSMLPDQTASTRCKYQNAA